ncbi:unnamed protein product [Phytophthora lilii]|uniref:Unnamed protein product n=1 Tax=Phytophthora lilii TaxID=2077276 RepID=A0A9W6U3Z1_9STRA|nr:unnamed protein product [Phytophthora lilii]
MGADMKERVWLPFGGSSGCHKSDTPVAAVGGGFCSDCDAPFRSATFSPLIRIQSASSADMQAIEDESKRVLKKQRLCVAQIDRQLDELLTHVEATKQQLEQRQHELCRKKNRHLDETAGQGEEGSANTASNNATGVDKADDEVQENAASAETKQDEVAVEEQDNETEYIVRDFIRRVRQLNVEKNVASELKAIHVLLSKYAKQIDKVGNCWRRLVAEYLYQDGQIDAADAMCKVSVAV